MTKTELAAQLGISGSMVSRLAKRGMPTDSLERAQRWRRRHLEPGRVKGAQAGAAAAGRARRPRPGNALSAAAAGPHAEHAEADQDADNDTPDATFGGYDYAASRAKREHFAAEREQALLRKEAGELMEVSEHVAAFAKAGATLRAGLEAWGAILPPQLIGRDEGAIRAVIAEQVEQLLHELTAQIGAMAQQADAAAPQDRPADAPTVTAAGQGAHLDA